MTIIAIDPGVSGGIAWRHDGGLVAAEPMPDTESDVKELLCTINGVGDCGVIAYVEDVPKHCGPKLPASTVAVMFRNYGFILGVLATLGIRTILVRPHDWQKYFRLGTKSGSASKTEWKNKLKAEAQRRFPHIKVTLATADALLIFDYAEEKP